MNNMDNKVRYLIFLILKTLLVLLHFSSFIEIKAAQTLPILTIDKKKVEVSKAKLALLDNFKTMNEDLKESEIKEPTHVLCTKKEWEFFDKRFLTEATTQKDQERYCKELCMNKIHTVHDLIKLVSLAFKLQYVYLPQKFKETNALNEYFNTAHTHTIGCCIIDTFKELLSNNDIFNQTLGSDYFEKKFGSYINETIQTLPVQEKALVLLLSLRSANSSRNDRLIEDSFCPQMQKSLKSIETSYPVLHNFLKNYSSKFSFNIICNSHLRTKIMPYFKIFFPRVALFISALGFFSVFGLVLIRKDVSNFALFLPGLFMIGIVINVDYIRHERNNLDQIREKMSNVRF